MEFSSYILADLTQTCMHFVHPLTTFNHTCSCLVCGIPRKKNDFDQPNLWHLMPLATPSDLDLVTSGSTSIRQVVVLGKNLVPELRGFCAELKTHINYSIVYEFANNDSNQLYHILVLIVSSLLAPNILQWFERMLAETRTQRAVILCDEKQAPAFQTLPFANKITLLVYENLNLLLKSLTHGMMFTKHRLMAKDVSRFANKEALHALHTQQNGMCLFL